jgi:hypothetical protein
MGQLENLKELSIAQSTHGKKKEEKKERNRKSSLISALVVSSNGDSNEFWGIESCI